MIKDPRSIPWRTDVIFTCFLMLNSPLIFVQILMYINPNVPVPLPSPQKGRHLLLRLDDLEEVKTNIHLNLCLES